MVRCEYGRCNRESDYYYEGHHICKRHWEEMCMGKVDLDKYFKVKK